MIKYLSAIILGYSILISSGQELTESDRANLLKKVEALKRAKVSKNNAELNRALTAFRKGAASDREAFDLYMLCQKQILSQNPRTSPGDLVDKLAEIRDKTTTADKRALRHQLTWLIPTIEAAVDPDQLYSSTNKLQGVLANIVNDTKTMNQKSVQSLGASPFNSIFGKAFDIAKYKPKEWPNSPLDYDGLYWGLICENLVARKQFNEARNQWAKRINIERSIIAAYDKKAATLTKAGELTPEVKKYVNNKAPVLKWKLEQALYQAGDERQALTEAYKIIEQFPTHKNYLGWLEWITDVLQPDKEESLPDE